MELFHFPLMYKRKHLNSKTFAEKIVRKFDAGISGVARVASLGGMGKLGCGQRNEEPKKGVASAESGGQLSSSLVVGYYRLLS